MLSDKTKSFITGLPKAELHLHICGTMEPEMMMDLSRRNRVSIRFKSMEEIINAYHFNDLQEFLDLYHEGTQVICKEQDLYDLTFAYLRKVHRQRVLHTEISVDPQTFLKRDIAIHQIFDGILHAMEDARKETGISVELVMDFIRDFDEESALETLDLAKPYHDRIIAVGLGSAEIGHPPSKFERVFRKAKEAGFNLTAHAGEEGPPEYVRESIDILGVSRIDHGIRAMEDPALVKRIADLQIPLTLCPLSNKALRIISALEDYPLREMLSNRMLVTVNSDDPAYFEGYINENYQAVAEALNLSEGILAGLAKNSFKASFLPDEKKAEFIDMVDDYYHAWEDGDR